MEKKSQLKKKPEKGGGWDDQLELELSGDDVESTPKKESVIPLPSRYPDQSQNWLSNSTLPFDHIAAGSFETAMDLLNKEYGIVNFGPMSNIFMNIFRSSSSFIFCGTSTGPLNLPLYRNWRDKGLQLPKLLYKFNDIIDSVQKAYIDVSDGKFTAALEAFQNVLITLPIVPIERDEDVEEKKQIIKICREYIIGIQIELTRKELSQSQGNDQRVVELALYFTHCDLQQSHKFLALKQAMILCASKKVYELAYNLATKVLEFDLSPAEEEKAQKILNHSEQKGRTNALQVNYDPRNPFVICASSNTPIYYGQPKVQCVYCKSSYIPEHQGKVCNICKISLIN